MSYCEVLGGSSEIRRDIITPVVDGMTYNRHGELRLLADKCSRCVLCTPMQLSSAGCSFSCSDSVSHEVTYKQMCHSCYDHVMIKYINHIGQIHVFKISILAELIVSAIDPSLPWQNSH